MIQVIDTLAQDTSSLEIKGTLLLKVKTDSSQLEDFQKYLSSTNLAELDEIKNEQDKLRFIKTRGIVNMLFAHDNCGAEAIWKRSKYAKPYIEGWDKDFSISHSTDISIVGVASEAIGVDIEDIGRDIDLAKFKRTGFLNFDEGAYESKEEFLMRFTALEAYLKYIGRGFYHDARDISVRKASGSIVIEDGKVIKAETIRDGDYIISIVMG